MGLRGYAEYLAVKYAGYDDFSSNPPDMSFGAPISPEKTRILKDKLILAYDKITDGITNLPEYQQLNSQLGTEHYWAVFQSLVTSLAAEVEFLPLKDAFSFSAKLIKALNELRDALVTMGPEKMPRDKMLKMDGAIKNLQDYIWKESKRILNLHDLKGVNIDVPELKGVLEQVVPTWDYGPGKNPTKPLLHKRPKVEGPGALMKRLMKEMEDEKKGK